jgi:hypothetical protein
MSHKLVKRHELRGLHMDASPCLVDRAVCRSAQKQRTPRWRLEEGEKVGNEKSDLSWNLPGGAQTQGQAGSRKEISWHRAARKIKEQRMPEDLNRWRASTFDMSQCETLYNKSFNEKIEEIFCSK